MTRSTASLSCLRVAILALFLGAVPVASEAGNVSIEGDRIRMSIGSERGYGVMSALRRYGLVDPSLGEHEHSAALRLGLVEPSAQEREYFAALKRLGPRMKNARVIVREHPGGSLGGTIADVEDIGMPDLPVRIVGRYCHSACTLFLGAKDLCISPETRFGFHQPRKRPGTRKITEKQIFFSVELMGSYYKPGLRDWWLNEGSRSKRLVYLDGRDLVKFGYRACEN